MSKIYTQQEKQKIRNHPLYVKYSGAVPDDLRHLVYPDEAKPEAERKASKRKATEEPVETDGDSN